MTVGKTRTFWFIWIATLLLYPVGLAPIGSLALLVLAVTTRWLKPEQFGVTNPTPSRWGGLVSKTGTAFVVWMAVTNLWAKDIASAVGTTAAFILIFSLADGSSRIIAADFDRAVDRLFPALVIITSLLNMSLIFERLLTSQRASFFGFLGSNYVASLALISGGLCWGYLLESQKRWAAQVRWPWSVLAVVGMLATGSRGGIIGLAALVLLSVRWNPRRLAAFVVAVALIVGLTWGHMNWTRPYDLERLAMWKAASHMMKDHPFGLGMQGFNAVYPQYKAPNMPIRHFAHNIFFQLGADLGYPGLALFILFILAVVYSGVKLVIRTRRPFHRLLLATFVAILIREMVDVSIIYSGGVDVVYWLVPGLVGALASLEFGGDKAAATDGRIQMDGTNPAQGGPNI